MVALTKSRLTPELASGGKTFVDPVAAAVHIFAGAMVALDAAGNAIPAFDGDGVIRGVAVAEVDNSAGAAGAVDVETRRGVFRFAQTGLTRAEIGDDVFVLDDQTVGVAGVAPNMLAGKLVQLDAGGAWVEIS